MWVRLDTSRWYQFDDWAKCCCEKGLGKIQLMKDPGSLRSCWLRCNSILGEVPWCYSTVSLRLAEELLFSPFCMCRIYSLMPLLFVSMCCTFQHWIPSLCFQDLSAILPMPDVLVVLELTGKILCQTKCKGDQTTKKGNFLSLISVYCSQIMVIFMMFVFVLIGLIVAFSYCYPVTNATNLQKR